MLRRTAVSLLSSVPAWGIVGAAQAQGDTGSEDLLAERGFVGIGGSGAAIGEGPPRREEVQKAFRIMRAAPSGPTTTPVEVAKYFASVEMANEPEGWLYNAEWPVDKRANPVITSFFTMTNTRPNKGDQTPWCAAFVNWCLAAADRNISFSAGAKLWEG